MLSSSQLYYIKKAKHRKALRVMAQIRRVCGSCMVNEKWIKYQLNEHLHKQFRINRMQELDETQYESYLQAIQGYQLSHMGHTFQ